jgi:hypothetical protein
MQRLLAEHEVCSLKPVIVLWNIGGSKKTHAMVTSFNKSRMRVRQVRGLKGYRGVVALRWTLLVLYLEINT